MTVLFVIVAHDAQDSINIVTHDVQDSIHIVVHDVQDSILIKADFHELLLCFFLYIFKHNDYNVNTVLDNVLKYRYSLGHHM